MTAAPVEHGNEARTVLRDVVAEYGPDVLSRPATLASLLADMLPDAPRLAKLFVMAAESGIAGELREHVAQGMDAATAAGLVASSLAARTMITPELCTWVVREFGIVMGLIAGDGDAPAAAAAPAPEPATRADAAGPAWSAGGPAWSAGPAGPAGVAGPAGTAGPAEPPPAWPGPPTVAAPIPAAAAGYPTVGYPAAGYQAAGYQAAGYQAAGYQAPPGGYPASPATIPGGPARAGGPRRKWAAAAIAGAEVLAVIVALVIWAPWTSPPVLRPAGLTSGTSTITSVAMTWSSPATGPLPDQYLILQGGKKIGSVPGTVTSYTAGGLAPDTSYHFQVRAVRGGRRSPRSSLLTASTLTPPVSAAILTGSWTVREKVLTASSGVAPAYARGKHWTESWQFSPGCLSGPLVGSCSLAVSGSINGGAFSATLRRAGAAYTGTFGTSKLTNCGSGHTPIHSTVRMRVQVSAAGPADKLWAASSWSGTMHVANRYTPVGGGSFCSATSWSASLGSP